MHDPVRQRREGQVGLLRGHARGDRRSEYRSPRPMSISESDFTMCVEERCTIVTSTPFSHSALQMSCAELFDADHHDLLADVARPGPGCALEWCCSPRKTSWPGQRRHVRLARHAGGEHQLRRVQRQPLAVAVDLDGPVPAPPRRNDADRHVGLRPVRHLHDPGVELEPVADLVLRREHRPVLRERQVGQVVVPDRVVQAQRLVAACATGRRAARACRRRSPARRADAAARRARCRPGRRR